MGAGNACKISLINDRGSGEKPHVVGLRQKKVFSRCATEDEGCNFIRPKIKSIRYKVKAALSILNKQINSRLQFKYMLAIICTFLSIHLFSQVKVHLN